MTARRLAPFVLPTGPMRTASEAKRAPSERRPRGDLDGARNVHELDLDAARAERLARQAGEDGGDPHAGDLAERLDRRLLRHGRLERAAPEPQAQELGDSGAALRDEVGARDPAVHHAVLDVLWDVLVANEEHLDRRVPAREGECALPGLLGAETGVVEQRDGRLAQPPLGRDGDLQALDERARSRSIASR